ncbi:MAG: transglutaminase domain-containing protein [Oscillospiraceae bacterium]|nr:transglutaminase domain-containing protein [Oscillospiraceae bacterium]
MNSSLDKPGGRNTRILIIAGGFLLITVAVFCTIGAIISAFSLDIDINALLPFWAIAALVLAVASSLLRGKGVLILSAPALALLIIKANDISAGAKWVIFRITSEYNKWLRVPVFFPDTEAAANELMLFFVALGVFIAFLLAVSICLRKSPLLTIIFSAPIVFLTFVLVETEPDSKFVLGLLAVYLTLLICSCMHPDDYIKRGKAAIPILALSIVILGAAFFVAPPAKYSRGEMINGVDDYLRSMAERIGLSLDRAGIGWPNMSAGEWSFNTERVGISGAGERIITNRELLDVTADEPGTYYLRGYSMRSFNGHEWLDSISTRGGIDDVRTEAAPALICRDYGDMLPEKAPQKVNMSIAKTGDASGLSYKPYYSAPMDLRSLIEAEIQNNGETFSVTIFGEAGDDRVSMSNYNSTYSVFSSEYVTDANQDSYSIDFYYARESLLGYYDALSPETPYISPQHDEWINAPSIYTQISESTAEGLRKIAIDAGIDPGADRAVIADKVAAYISSAARYTLKPYIIPNDEDFALYFLQTSKMGYCIHFATAATLMLRALDIPARFTSGFVVTVPANYGERVVKVTDRNAHAWVEVYYDDIGWLPLEVTPSRSGSGVPIGLPHTAIAAVPENEDEAQEPFDDTFRDELPERERFDTPTQPPVSDDFGPGHGGTGAEGASSAGLKALLYILLGCALLACGLIARRRVVLARRRNRFALQDANAAAIHIWVFAARVCKPDFPPIEMEDIAMKARFSRHEISDEERGAMLAGLNGIIASKYSGQKVLKRLWLKYVRCV